MANRNDKLWNENFAHYMDYVNTYHRLPPARAIHKGVAVGGWLRNQINFYLNRWPAFCLWWEHVT